MLNTESIKFALQDIDAKYEERLDSPAFVGLYEGSRWEHIFAVLHEELNQRFAVLNPVITSGITVREFGERI